MFQSPSSRLQQADFSLLLLGTIYETQPDTVDDWQLSLASRCARHLYGAATADTLALSPYKLVPPKNAF